MSRALLGAGSSIHFNRTVRSGPQGVCRCSLVTLTDAPRQGAEMMTIEERAERFKEEIVLFVEGIRLDQVMKREALAKLEGVQRH
jgi:hypothetical protein